MTTQIGLGKIILLGEHAVVYGYPALAAALDRGVTMGAVPTPAGGSLRLDIPSWNVKLTAEDDHARLHGCSGGSQCGAGRDHRVQQRQGDGCACALEYRAAGNVLLGDEHGLRCLRRSY